MGKNFHVQVLNDKEFDSLPYRNISNSLGIADPEKEMAFVRESGLGKEFDFATLVHEVNHLVETHKTDVDEDGIMHKGGGSVWQKLGNALIGAPQYPGEGSSSPQVSRSGQLIAKPGGTSPGFGAPDTTNRARGTGNIDELLGKTPAPIAPLTSTFEKSQAQQFGEPVTFGGQPSTISGSGGKLISTPTPPAPAPSGFNLDFSPMTPMNILGKTRTAPAPAIKTPAPIAPPAPNEQTIAGKTFPTPAPAAPSRFSSGVPIDITAPENRAPASAALLGNTAPELRGTPMNAQPVEPAPSLGSRIGKGIESFVTDPQNILGLGSSLLASQVKQPEFQMPPSVEEIRKTLLAPQGGLTDVGKQARIELGDILKSTPQQLYPPQNDAYYQAVLRRTRNSYEIAKKNLDAQYNLAGVYGSGEHLAAQAKLQEQLTNAETDLFAATEARNFELARTAKYQAIQDSLGLDKDVMDDLVGLTGLDVQQAAIIYGAKVQDVQAIREALGTLGAELLSRGKVQGQAQPAIV